MNSTNSHTSGEMKTGIILFSRSRNCEARSKKWHSSHSKNLQIAQHLIERTKSVLTSTGYDVILIDETKQRGETFGEKIRFAFEDAYNLGYEQLILVGNDSIGLSEAYINASIEFLNQQGLVFGATHDNGLYLIGFERTFFQEQAEQIATLPWRTNRLARAFSEMTGFTGSSILPILHDLNTIEDIKKLLKSATDQFSEILRGIVHGLSRYSKIEDFSILQELAVAKIRKRGPPGFLQF